MTTYMFKESEEHRSGLAEALKSQSLHHALLALLDDIYFEQDSLPDEADAIASVRMLAFRQGAERIVKRLPALVYPNPPEPKEVAATFQKDEEYAKLEQAQQTL